jgi:hypothetical protein
MGTPIAFDRVTSLSLDPGAQVVVRGLVTTSLDGSGFDAPALFDLEGGGPRIAEQRENHSFVLAPSGEPGTACATAGVGSPCLVPRVAELAHARLRTRGELASSMHGAIELEGVLAPPVAPAPDVSRVLVIAGLLAAAVVVTAVALAGLRRRACSAFGRVHAAAREALRATRGDPTLERVRSEVHGMVARARDLEEARRACLKRLAGVNRAALDRKRDAYARSPSPDAAETLAWLTAECAEAERLESDLSSSILGLQRIESALHVVALRVREHRGTRARIARHDPVDAAAAELHLRDEARAEADRAIGL